MAAQPPEWVKDAVFYQIFPDRFAKSLAVPKPDNLEPWASPPTTYGFKGGDLIGVAEHLDYLEALGVTAIYFNPIFQSTANHRYHTHDFFLVDPILGGNEAFRELLDAAHARGLRIVIDGVFNHASRGFYYFNHLLENGPASPFIDWFFVLDKWPINAYDLTRPPGYAAWWGLHALPKFNTNTPAVREYLWRVAEFWIRFGADGWRLDVPNEINDDAFWRTFRTRVKTENPDAYIVGEIWHEAGRWLQGDMFDGVMNYLFTRAIVGFVVGANAEPHLLQGIGYGPVPVLDAAEFAHQVEVLLTLYPPEITMTQLNLLGSHDTPRILSIANQDVSAVRLAALLLMTFPGAPCIYYGDEIGMLGGKDPGNRSAFPWQSEAAWNHALLDEFKYLIAVRREYPALRRGEFKILYAQDPLFAFARRLANQTLIVAVNVGRRRQPLPLPVTDRLGLPEGTRLHNLLAPRDRPYEVVGGQIATLALGPRAGAVLVVDAG
ncbi:MAG: alpha-amylase family glycosyl hydrolase [Ardenticatenaceae bacterium]|nr:alpha-amylase family glycosyl hydrolase [Ardenticatenaceae bacterium]HBY97393.1 alpha-amylase [Chloroflexota bacterium]